MSNEPRTVGDYRLVASLGMGGMAHVHLAISTRAGGFQKLLVLKTLRAEFAEDPDFRRMFMDEARIAARFNHPNVVHTYEVGEHEGKIFIAMEYLEGQALSTVLSRVGRDSMPTAVGLRALADALAGLHYAHELTDYDGKPLNLVHRDVSPQNVFVTYMGHAKILDFGIAKGSLSGGQTQSGVIKGKVGYMAPEQVMGGALDRRADVFAVGVMLWEMLAKTRFVGRTEEEVAVITRRIQGRDRGIREAAPTAPEDLLAICERAMAHDPSARFPTALAMQDAIEGYLAKEGGGDARAVAALLEIHFKEERSKVRRVVEESVKSVDASGPLVAIRESSHTGSSSVEVPIPVATETQTQRPKTPAYAVFGGLGVAAVVGLVAVYALGRHDARAPASGVAAITSLPTPSPSAVPSATIATSAASASPSTFQVRVSTSPKGALLSLDGTQVENPYAGSLSASPHHFRAQAAGFRTVERTVTPQGPEEVTLTLERVPAGSDPAALPTTHPKKPRRDIDDTDPYK